MKVWILFAEDGDGEFVDEVFALESAAKAAKESREKDGFKGFTFRIDWFEVK